MGPTEFACSKFTIANVDTSFSAMETCEETASRPSFANRFQMLKVRADSTVPRRFERYRAHTKMCGVRIWFIQVSLERGEQVMEFSFEVNPDLDIAIGTELSFDDQDVDFVDTIDISEIDPLDSTAAKPGSEDKVRMLAARYAAGVPLWHDSDCYDHGPTDTLSGLTGSDDNHFDMDDEL